MNQQQWINWRREGIGSSDAAILMNGVHFGKTPFQLWEEKVFGNSEQFENTAMRRGKDLEETARQEFEKQLNTVVFPKNVVNADHSWLRASLDGIDPAEKIMVEIKCPNKDDHKEAVNKKVPEKYYAQCQHQLAVTGLPGMYYFSFDGSNGVIVEVPRDQNYIDVLLSKEAEFWDKVLNKIPPVLCMDYNDGWKRLSKKWKETKKQLKELLNEETVIREQLIALSNNVSARGHNISLTKSECDGAIDYNAAHKDYLDNMRSHYPDIPFPDIATEPYRKKSFVKWTVRAI